MSERDDSTEEQEESVQNEGQEDEEEEEINQKTLEAQFLRALGENNYASPKDIGLDFNIPASMADTIVKDFVEALTRSRNDKDWPMRALKKWNEGVDEEDQLTKTDVARLGPLMAEYGQKVQIIKKEKSPEPMEVYATETVQKKPVNVAEIQATLEKMKAQGIDMSGVKVLPDGKVILDVNAFNQANTPNVSDSGIAELPYSNESALMSYLLDLHIPRRGEFREKIPTFMKLFNAKRNRYWENATSLLRDLKITFGPGHGETVYEAWESMKGEVTDNPMYLDRVTGVSRLRPQVNTSSINQNNGNMDMMGIEGTSPEERALFAELGKQMKMRSIQQLMNMSNGGEQPQQNQPQGPPTYIRGNDGNMYAVHPATNVPFGAPIGNPFGQHSNGESKSSDIILKSALDMLSNMVAQNQNKTATPTTQNPQLDSLTTVLTTMLKENMSRIMGTTDPMDQMTKVMEFNEKINAMRGVNAGNMPAEVRIKEIELDAAKHKIDVDANMKKAEEDRMRTEAETANQRLEMTFDKVGGIVEKFADPIGQAIGRLVEGGLGGMLQGMVPGMGAGGVPQGGGNGVPPGMVQVNTPNGPVMVTRQQYEVAMAQARAQQNPSSVSQGSRTTIPSGVASSSYQSVAPQPTNIQETYENQNETPDDVIQKIQNMPDEQLEQAIYNGERDISGVDGILARLRAEQARRRTKQGNFRTPTQRYVAPIVRDMRAYEQAQMTEAQQNAVAAAAMLEGGQAYVEQPRVSAEEVFGIEDSGQGVNNIQSGGGAMLGIPGTGGESPEVDNEERIRPTALPTQNVMANAAREESAAQGYGTGSTMSFGIPSTQSLESESQSDNNISPSDSSNQGEPVNPQPASSGDKKSSHYQVVFDDVIEQD